MSVGFLGLVENRYNLHFLAEAAGSERVSSSPRATQLVTGDANPVLMLQPGPASSCFHRSINTGEVRAPQEDRGARSDLPKGELSGNSPVLPLNTTCTLFMFLHKFSAFVFLENCDFKLVVELFNPRERDTLAWASYTVLQGGSLVSRSPLRALRALCALRALRPAE